MGSCLCVLSWMIKGGGGRAPRPLSLPRICELAPAESLLSTSGAAPHSYKCKWRREYGKSCANRTIIKVGKTNPRRTGEALTHSLTHSLPVSSNQLFFEVRGSERQGDDQTVRNEIIKIEKRIAPQGTRGTHSWPSRVFPTQLF